jgi:glycerol kinase
MPENLILAIDQGTHATRAVIFDEYGNTVDEQIKEVALYKTPDGINQNPDEIRQSADAVIQAVFRNPVVQRNGVKCAGLTTQRSSVIAWDRRTGNPLPDVHVISWQDRRNEKWLKTQISDKEAENIKQRTGLRVSPHYGASKLRWYLDTVKSVQEAKQAGYLAFGPLAAFIVSSLLKGHPLYADHANASRTQLWNINDRDWDPYLLNLFGIEKEFLPQCKPIRWHYGYLRDELLCGCKPVPLTAVNGDQTAAIYSLGRPRRHTAIINIGTGAFILFPTGDKIIYDPCLLSGLSDSSEKRNEYIIEGTVNGAGAALDWAYQEWGLSKAMADKNLSEWLYRKEEPPLFMNTVGGLGSPWWIAEPPHENRLIGDGEPWQKLVAVAESILFMLKANLDRMIGHKLPVKRLQVSGGVSRTDGICQRLANLTGLPVYRPAETEATARGIAWLAASCPENWSVSEEKEFLPEPDDEGIGNRYKRFLEAVNSEQ